LANATASDSPANGVARNAADARAISCVTKTEMCGLSGAVARVVVLVTRTRNVILEEHIVTLEEKERKRDDP
jgi:hypothetical protein